MLENYARFKRELVKIIVAFVLLPFFLLSSTNKPDYMRLLQFIHNFKALMFQVLVYILIIAYHSQFAFVRLVASR